MCKTKPDAERLQIRTQFLWPPRGKHRAFVSSATSGTETQILATIRAASVLMHFHGSSLHQRQQIAVTDKDLQIFRHRNCFPSLLLRRGGSALSGGGNRNARGDHRLPLAKKARLTDRNGEWLRCGHARFFARYSMMLVTRSLAAFRTLSV
jgi:hypothetical protein